jgi:hypothetical protein
MNPSASIVAAADVIVDRSRESSDDAFTDR